MRTFSSKIFALLVATTLAGTAGCMTDPDTDDGSGEEVVADDDGTLGETSQALADSFQLTLYYSNASQTTQVGYCYTASICSGPQRRCFGSQTAYKVVELHSCL